MLVGAREGNVMLSHPFAGKGEWMGHRAFLNSEWPVENQIALERNYAGTPLAADNVFCVNAFGGVSCVDD
jgi:hypothetical protein